ALELSDEDRRWIEAGSTAEVRAVRARKAMQRRQEEAQKAEHLLGVFGVGSEE
ncbi:ACAD11, partial [Symbiodinium necroappetens]